ncbi:tryptophan synthase subunit alpha [Leuconostoc miyukkimchii]|uniref:tryptophan synthase subunit alpha n=1 Tax=Leuconostoc miyukkimchii TaxID=910540 RepID=UPI001C7D5195|nr:tryptophan synthase subunit alpha [Leuconostoc miyukkimchii]
MTVEKIENVLKNGKGFIGFTVAGDPNFSKSVDYVVSLAESGADVVEIGIAFSDPSADGDTIMKADLRALNAGSTTERVFEMVGKIRERTQVPLVFLTYVNPVFKYGFDRFLAKMQSLNVEGIIMPDMPLEEQAEFVTLAEKYERSFIQLVTLKSGNRIPKLMSRASGFVYVVSSLGITGARKKLTTESRAIIEKIRTLTDLPIAIGFGISTPKQVAQFDYADAVIVGSAIVSEIEAHPYDAEHYLENMVQAMKAAR